MSSVRLLGSSEVFSSPLCISNMHCTAGKWTEPFQMEKTSRIIQVQPFKPVLDTSRKPSVEGTNLCLLLNAFCW